MKYEVLRTEQLVYHRFNVPVLNGLDLSLYQSEILGFVGLKGSGLFSLVDILSGLIGQSDGAIYVDDRLVKYHSVLEAQRLGIYCIRHKSNLIHGLTVADNMCILPPSRFQDWIINQRTDNSFARKTLDELVMPINYNIKAETLSLAEKHLVEIVRAVSNQAKVIILDDIMLSYTEKEYLNLYLLLKRIQSRGIALIVIDSKLERLLQLSNRVIVVQAGRNIGFFYSEEFNLNNIQKVLAGIDFELKGAKPSSENDEILLMARNICNQHLHNLNFYIKRGEVVGFIDEDSKKCNAIVDLLNGNGAIEQGHILLNGREIQLNRGRKEMIAQGIGYIGYYKASLFPQLSLADNLTIAGLDQLSGKFGINMRMERFVVKEYAQKLGINQDELNKNIGRADNRTQMNVALYKWMVAKTPIIVMDNTFSGADVMMQNCIYDFISEVKKQKMGIIYMSPNEQEIYDVCDRIYRLENGYIIG